MLNTLHNPLNQQWIDNVVVLPEEVIPHSDTGHILRQFHRVITQYHDIAPPTAGVSPTTSFKLNNRRRLNGEDYDPLS
jgi:hypothetical protein